MWIGMVFPGLCGGFRKEISVASSESEEAETDLVGALRLSECEWNMSGRPHILCPRASTANIVWVFSQGGHV